MIINKDYYVYLHRRQDTGAVFYVGKGKNSRAGAKSFRNRWWMSTVSKYGYTIDYVAKNLSEKEAFELEVKTIKFYRDSGQSLCNLTDGGEGASGAMRKQPLLDGVMMNLDIKIPSNICALRLANGTLAKDRIGAALRVVLANILSGNKIYYLRGSKLQKENNRKKITPHLVIRAIGMLLDLGYIKEVKRTDSSDSVKMPSSIITTGKCEDRLRLISENKVKQPSTPLHECIALVVQSIPSYTPAHHSSIP